MKNHKRKINRRSRNPLGQPLLGRAVGRAFLGGHVPILLLGRRPDALLLTLDEIVLKLLGERRVQEHRNERGDGKAGLHEDDDGLQKPLQASVASVRKDVAASCQPFYSL